MSIFENVVRNSYESVNDFVLSEEDFFQRPDIDQERSSYSSTESEQSDRSLQDGIALNEIYLRVDALQRSLNSHFREAGNGRLIQQVLDEIKQRVEYLEPLFQSRPQFLGRRRNNNEEKFLNLGSPILQRGHHGIENSPFIEDSSSNWKITRVYQNKFWICSLFTLGNNIGACTSNGKILIFYKNHSRNTWEREEIPGKYRVQSAIEFYSPNQNVGIICASQCNPRLEYKLSYFSFNNENHEFEECFSSNELQKISKVIHISENEICVCGSFGVSTYFVNSEKFTPGKVICKEETKSIFLTSDGYLISCNGKVLKIYSKRENEWEDIYENEAVNCCYSEGICQLNDSTIVVGDNKKIHFIRDYNDRDPHTYYFCCPELDSDVNSVAKLKENALLCAMDSGYIVMISFISLDTWQVRKVRVCAEGLYSVIVLNQDTFAVCSTDGEVIMWEKKW